MARKDGLQSAIEFTKFIITIDSALIAFLTGASFVGRSHNILEICVSIAALVFLALSLTAGIFTQMRAATMLSKGIYDLNDPYLRWPGAVNVIGLALAAGMISWLAIAALLAPQPKSERSPSFQCVNCINRY